MSDFARDVDEGLSASEKFLSSRYFYDALGDEIFQQIMQMPEYYLTNCEYEIFESHKDEILKSILPNGKFNLVELGAGDGYKTKVLLQHFLTAGVDFEYFPVDISGDVLQHLETSLKNEMPSLKVTTLNYEYFAALEELNRLQSTPRVILFLGSNIGNFSPQRATSFFKGLYEVSRSGDHLISGIDLKKDPDVILKAYNDKAGITASFNLNLLKRINRELGGNFIQANWQHYPVYNPGNGEARSYLISLADQEVRIEETGKTYQFRKYEAIHMEISRKYSLDEIEELAGKSGFAIKKHFLDKREYFADSIWLRK